jgi:S1-C subfamily serine protease
MSLLSDLSASISGLAAEASPRIVAVRGADGSSFSGFIWRTGLVVVAEEALEGEEELDLLFADGKTVKAKLAGRDPTTDVALLETETSEFPEWAAAPAATPGSLALVAGRSEESLVARLATIVSVGPKWQSRRGGEIAARITLDQRLSRRSEGAAVIAPDGSLVGMAVTAAGGRAIVIPTLTIAAAVATLKEKGYVPRGWLGVMLHPMTAGSGAIVLSAEDDSPAAKAGLLVGDVITTWNGEDVGNVGNVAQRLTVASVGQQIKLGVSRGGNAHELDITIGERPRG